MTRKAVIIQTSRRMRRFVIVMMLTIIVFLFWLGLSSAARQPAAIIFAAATLAAAGTTMLIKSPPALGIDDNGLTILTPLGNAYFSWDSFLSFAIRRADPWTTFIIFKLKPGIDRPWFLRVSAPRKFDGGLFPYMEIRNDELLRILKGHQYRGRTKLLI